MKGTIICCAVLVLCLAACAATGTTAILIDPAQVYKNTGELIDTLPREAKVIPGRINGQWVHITYQKAGEDAPRAGWVKRTVLEQVPEGFDSRASEHCIVHSQDPMGLQRFDTNVFEDLYTRIARSLLNAEGEPAFNPNVKLRIYLLNGAAFAEQAKANRQSPDAGAFAPRTGQVYIDFSLRTTTSQMKGLVVHEFAILVLRDYANQPTDRRGAGAALPVWLIEAFATYHEFEAGFNTSDLLYVPKEPRLSSLTSRRTVPTKFEYRRAYLATAGTLGHLLLNFGTRQQFSQLVRRVQASAGGTRADAIMLEIYGLSRTKFQAAWATYLEQLKKKHGIDKIEEELKEDDEKKEDGLPDGVT